MAAKKKKIKKKSAKPARPDAVPMTDEQKFLFDLNGWLFIPGVLDMKILDAVITVENDDALEMARRLAREEGILCGISSGAAVAAALKWALGDGQDDELIVAIVPSFGERYIQTVLFEPYRYEGSDDIGS